MKREDVRKLLGGYATGTLTPDEQQALFEAALNDQELFDALAGEEALRAYLADPSFRQELLERIEPVTASRSRRWWDMLRPGRTAGSPWSRLPVYGALAAGAAALLFVGLFSLGHKPRDKELPQSTIAMRRSPEPADQALRDASPAPRPGSANNFPAAPQEEAKLARRVMRYESEARQLPAPPPLKPKAEELASARPPAGIAGGSPSLMARNTAATPAEAPLRKRKAIAAAAAPRASTGAQVGAGGLVERPLAGLAEDIASGLSQPAVPYTVLRLGTDGHYAKIPTDSIQPGDSIRLAFDPTQDGYLRISLREAAGAGAVLFPVSGTGRVSAAGRYQVPVSGAIHFEGVEQKQIEVLFTPQQPARAKDERRPDAPAMRERTPAAVPAPVPQSFVITLSSH